MVQDPAQAAYETDIDIDRQFQEYMCIIRMFHLRFYMAHDQF